MVGALGFRRRDEAAPDPSEHGVGLMVLRCTNGHSVSVRPGEVRICPTCQAQTRARLEAEVRRARARYEQQLRQLRARVRR
jgi:hypothetical protein